MAKKGEKVDIYTVKVFSRTGVIHNKIHEEETDNLDRVIEILKEWKHADLVEVFYQDRLLFVYMYS